MKALVAAAKPVGSSGATIIGSPSMTTRNRNGVSRSIPTSSSGHEPRRLAPAHIRNR